MEINQKKRAILHSAFLIGCLMFALMGCSVGPSYSPPQIEVPSDWKNDAQKKCDFEKDEKGECIYLDHWWEVFDDEKLKELENLAISNNKNLYVAYERILEAQALMGVAVADLYPQVTLNPSSTNTVELIKNYRNNRQTSTNSSSSGNSLQNDITKAIGNFFNIRNNVFRVHEMLYALPINLSYEVDLWGKIRDRVDSASYHWLAQNKDYEALMLSLTANLATVYYQLRVADSQIDLLSDIIKTRRKALEINQARYDEELVFYADVSLAGEEVDNAVRQFNEISRQRDLLEDQIAVLIGVPASDFTVEHHPLTGQPPCIPGGIPSEILLRRPDIAEAEYVMRAEHALVKEAYTQFFPSLILTATTGFESPVLKEFLNWISRFWMDGLQINQLIFDGWKTESELKMQIAQFSQASGEYQQQVLVAFREVEDALANLDSYSKQYDAALGANEWAQKTYQLYLDRYTMDLVYYIDVVNTERDLLNYRLVLSSMQGFQYLATIQFIKALGGGWAN